MHARLHNGVCQDAASLGIRHGRDSEPVHASEPHRPRVTVPLHRVGREPAVAGQLTRLYKNGSSGPVTFLAFSAFPPKTVKWYSLP